MDSIYKEDKQKEIADGSNIYHTAKELRYVKTNWEDREFQEGLLFYNEQSRVCAPWISPFDKQWASSKEETLAIDPMAEYLVNPAKSKELKETMSALQNISIRINVEIAEYDAKLQELNNILLDINNTRQWIDNELKQSGCVDTLLSFFGIRKKVEERIRPKIEHLNDLAKEKLACIQQLHEMQNFLEKCLVIFSQHIDFLNKYFAFLRSL